MLDARVRPSRAWPSLTAACILLGLVLAACGEGAGETDAADADRAAGFPAAIEHRYGTTRIESEPSRVVTVGYNEQDFVLALGVQPVGVREWFGGRPSATWRWARDELADAEPEVLPAGDLSFEQIAALNPDLIVGPYSGMSASDYDKLSGIAPTVAAPQGEIDFGMRWQDQMRLIGRALGRGPQAEELIRDVEDRFAQARAAHPEFREATAVIAYRGEGGTFGAYASEDPRARFLRSLGFRMSAEIEELAGDEFFAEISGEQLRMIDQDVLVMIDIPDVAVSRGELSEVPLYRRLEVVRDRRDVYPSVDPGAAMSFGTPLSLPVAIDALVPQLAEATRRLDEGTRPPSG